ncbi:Serine/threonine-protein kinase HT1 [Morella rubra]|uniref:Serine/threonine-protein kinase HT1 n=1 Tax=Morella rubra TaxID=262757 RepID=A0A6A1VK30_9ROSI|nr:Serine/threonine-protein kinase HT1 [Morella rubra]
MVQKVLQEWEIDPSQLITKSVIDRGTFGTVFRGIYDGRDVTIKILDWSDDGTKTEAEIASSRTAFTQQVAVWQELNHPNVSKFIGATLGLSQLQIVTDNGRPCGIPSNGCCVVEEYLPAGNLRNYLVKKRRTKLAFKVVIQLALDVVKGLSYLHSHKIVHRDVKPENMLLDKARRVKISEFGVARIEASNPNDMTAETGTLGYMAPEVLRENPYNRKCDIYSFGISLWEIYCCDMPYPDLSFSEVAAGVVGQNFFFCWAILSCSNQRI